MEGGGGEELLFSPDALSSGLSPSSPAAPSSSFRHRKAVAAAAHALRATVSGKAATKRPAPATGSPSRRRRRQGRGRATKGSP